MSEISEAHRDVWQRAAKATAEELRAQAIVDDTMLRARPIEIHEPQRHNDVRIDALEAKVDRLSAALNEAQSQLSRVCGDVDGMQHERTRRRWRLP